MYLDSALGKIDLLGYFLVATPLYQQRQYLLLAFRQNHLLMIRITAIAGQIAALGWLAVSLQKLHGHINTAIKRQA